MEQEWIKICEYNKQDVDNWLNKLLDSEHIPYKTEIEGYWKGNVKVPEYKEKIVMYIPVEFSEQVEKYIEDYNNTDNIITDDVAELKSSESEDELEKEAKRRSKNQKKAILGITAVVLGMVLLMIICGIIAK